jgi:hypothetical protein
METFENIVKFNEKGLQIFKDYLLLSNNSDDNLVLKFIKFLNETDRRNDRNVQDILNYISTMSLSLSFTEAILSYIFTTKIEFINEPFYDLIPGLIYRLTNGNI